MAQSSELVRGVASEAALLVVDVQRDFCAGGALPVPDAESVIPVLNRYIALFTAHGRPIFLSRDWHPQRTYHFRRWGGHWPEHCVHDTPGATFHPELSLPRDAVVISKGITATNHGHSAFDGTDPADAPLAASFRSRGIGRVYVAGLATDHCVRSTVLDGAALGYDMVLLVDAVRGIELHPGDVERAIRDMREAGARLARIADVEGEMDRDPAPSAARSALPAARSPEAGAFGITPMARRTAPRAS